MNKQITSSDLLKSFQTAELEERVAFKKWFPDDFPNDIPGDTGPYNPYPEDGFPF